MTRLFELDFQLLHDTVFLAISVFFLCVALSYLLFEPARKLLRERTEHIGDELRMAKKEKKQGEKYRASYEKHLQVADKEVERLLSEARSKAEKQEEKMINEAKAERQRILARAKEEAGLERARVADEMKREMIAVAAMMAAKVAAASVTPEVQNKLVEETLREMGERTWRS